MKTENRQDTSLRLSIKLAWMGKVIRSLRYFIEGLFFPCRNGEGCTIIISKDAKMDRLIAYRLHIFLGGVGGMVVGASAFRLAARSLPSNP